jgi:SAM-dependent methyltransferase
VDPTAAYSTRAAHYARYRWEYAPAAIRALLDVAQIGPSSVVADVGAGTGILARQIVKRQMAGYPGERVLEQIYAIEPNAEMRRFARETLAPYPACTLLDGRAEAIPLPDRCVDLIVVGQAIHWFEPEPARAEFRRIARPGGWLALLRNYGTDAALGRAMAGLLSEENGVDRAHAARRPWGQPPGFFLSEGQASVRTFPFVRREPWEAFLGSLLSASYAPDESHSLYPRFERAARVVFERSSVGGLLEVRGETELCMGRV